MPHFDKEKPGVDLLAQQPSSSVVGIPIKKRLLALSRSTSPSSGVLSCLPKGHDESVNRSIHSETEPSISENSEQQCCEGATLPMNAPALGNQDESPGKTDLNLVPERGHLMLDQQGFGFGVPPNADYGVCKLEESVISNKSALPQKCILATKQLTYLTAGEKSAEGKLASSSKSAFRRVPGDTGTPVVASQLPMGSSGAKPTSMELSGLHRDGQHCAGISVKLEEQDKCSNVLSLVEDRCNQPNKHTDTETKVDFGDTNRLNWDLNTVMDACDGSLLELAMNHQVHKGFYETDDHYNNRETNPLQMEAERTDLTMGGCQVLKTDHNLNLSKSTSALYNPEFGLDLQLRPPSRSDLSLNLGVYNSLNIPLSGNSDLAVCRPVKAEPCEKASQEDNNQVDLSSMKTIGHRPIKTELCERNFQEVPKSSCSSNIESAASSNTKRVCVSTVKLEPREEPPEKCLAKPEEQHLQGKFEKHTQMASVTNAPQSANKLKVMGLFSNSPVGVQNKVNIDLKMATNAGNVSTTTSIAGNASGMQLEPPFDRSKSHYPWGVPSGTSESVSDTSNFVLERPTAQVEEVIGAKDAFKLGAVAASDFPWGSLVSDGKRSAAAEDMSRVIAPIGSSGDKFHPCNVTMADGHQVCLHEGSDIDGRNEERVGVSVEVLEEGLNDKEIKSHESFDVKGDEKLACIGGSEVIFPEGEVKYPMLPDGEAIDPVLRREGSSEQSGEHQVPGSLGLVDVPIKMPLDGDGGRKMQSPDNNTGGPPASSSERRLVKTTHRITMDHISKEKAPQRKPKYNTDTQDMVDKDGKGQMSGNLVNVEVPDVFLDKLVTQKDEPVKGYLGKPESGKDKHSRIIKLNSAIDKSSHDMTKSNTDRPLSAQSEREKLTDKDLRRSRPYSRWNREESGKDRFQAPGIDRSQDQSSGKHGRDSVRFNNYPDILDRAKNPEPKYVPGKFRQSNHLRYPRHNNPSNHGHSVASDSSVASDGRVFRRPMVDERRNSSRLPSRRRSPGRRDGDPVVDVQVGGYPVISPGRFVGREIPDFLPLATEERLVQPMPGVVMDHPFHLHQQLQYERTENSFMRRARRSLSPVPRRGLPFHLAPECLKSSPRAQGCSSQQWSPPRRPPSVFDEHPELVHGRSPPITRHDRIRQQPCFPENEMVRRPGPHFVPQIPEDARDHLHLRRNSFLGHPRVLEPNMPRFDMIDPRETAEEEYFERLHYDQFFEIPGEDECIDARRLFDERNGVRPVRQHFSVNDGGGENFASRVEDGRPRPSRVRPQPVEAFNGRGNSRNFDGNVRNRLGNLHDRLRGMGEQQYRSPQEWPDADFGDVRPKRRRL